MRSLCLCDVFRIDRQALRIRVIIFLVWIIKIWYLKTTKRSYDKTFNGGDYYNASLYFTQHSNCISEISICIIEQVDVKALLLRAVAATVSGFERNRSVLHTASLSLACVFLATTTDQNEKIRNIRAT